MGNGRRPIVLWLAGLTVALFLLSRLFGSGTGFGGTLRSLTYFVGFAAVMAWFVRYTGEGRRLWSTYVEPLYKPKGTDRQFWNEDGTPYAQNPRRTPGSAPTQDDNKLNFRGQVHGKWVLPGVIALLVILVIVVLALSHPENAMESMRQDSEGVSTLLEGLFRGEPEKLADGGGALLRTIWRDLRLVLILFGVFGAIFLILFVVRRKTNKKNRYQDDKEEDEWR